MRSQLFFIRVVPATLLLFCTALAGVAGARQAAAPVPVRYLTTAPAIDGVLDPQLSNLPPLALPLTTAPPAGSAGKLEPPAYRLGYGADFLYVFVEIDTAALSARDRAYQNGDGVILVVAAPKGRDEASDEFYVLGFSPGATAARWQRRFVWYRNVDLSMRALDNTLVATASSGGRSFFEILVPWSDVTPHHPWLSQAVGFNLCVTRALPENRSARYCATEDNRVDSEQSPRRYSRLAFEEATAGGGLHAHGLLERNHLAEGEVGRLRLATVAGSPGTLPVTVTISSGEGERIASKQSPLKVTAGAGVHLLDLPSAGLAPGGYTVSWQAGETSRGRGGLSVLPAASFASMSSRLQKVRNRVAAGSLSSLQFQLESLEGQQRRLRPSDTAGALRLELQRFLVSLDRAERGEDTVAARRGMFRRAFRSAVDGTLQPYSVKVPANYDRDRGPYPLLVFLHGSGQDDRNELNSPWLPQDFILLAPYARGTSHWYTADHAQDDIREAVADVMANYAVDPSRVVLAGFSMGGYGVYRTYKEDPERYKALAVFSGLPRLPGGNADAPDFLEKEKPALFENVPVFVFHGGKDRNCPIELTRALVARLKAAGVKVQFQYEDDKGHETPGEETIRAFHAWLGQVFRP